MLDWNIDHSWTLFLDRDGVINERKMGGYTLHVDEFKFLPKIPETIAALSQLFSYVFVATNQQGIAKKVMTRRNLSEIHAYMCSQVKLHGGKIDKVYYAPELKNEKSKMRKPNPGMALEAKKDFPTVDFQKSIMVGDTDSDILFGMNLGMKTVRIKTEEPIGIQSDLTVSSLVEFYEWIKK